jgi:hypothetical protein
LLGQGTHEPTNNGRRPGWGAVVGVGIGRGIIGVVVGLVVDALSDLGVQLRRWRGAQAAEAYAPVTDDVEIVEIELHNMRPEERDVP